MALYTPEEIARMTPAEQEVARTMIAAEASGEDVFGDGETTAAAAAAADAEVDNEVDNVDADVDSEGGTTDEAAEQPAAEAKPEDKPADAPAAEAAADAPPADEEPAAEQPLGFKSEAPADADKTLADLRKQRLDARKKWSAGEIDEDELEALEAPIESRIAEIQQQQAVAAAMAEADRQLRQREIRTTVEQLRAEGLKAGLDYSKGDATKPDGADAVEFDRQLSALEMDPAWVAKGPKAILTEAHRKVMLLAGKSAAPAPSPAPAAAAAPAPAQRRPVSPTPPTLRDVPAADRANAGNDLEEQWKAAKNQVEMDRIWTKLSPAQQSRLMGE
jgi:hypothetical protein